MISNHPLRRRQQIVKRAIGAIVPLVLFTYLNNTSQFSSPRSGSASVFAHRGVGQRYDIPIDDYICPGCHACGAARKASVTQAVFGGIHHGLPHPIYLIRLDRRCACPLLQLRTFCPYQRRAMALGLAQSFYESYERRSKRGNPDGSISGPRDFSGPGYAGKPGAHSNEL